MDEMLYKLNKLYPRSGYVSIPAYNAEAFKDIKYDSSLDTKQAKNRWSTNPLSYEQAQEEVANGNRVGWIVPEGYVVVDIDNKDDARSQEYLERLLEKFQVKYSYNYTNKGMHILFKDPSTAIKSVAKQKCGLNIEIDTRANKTGYIVLPCNDPHRAWGEWNDYVEDIPYFLKPLMLDNTPTFIGMVNGDGRNDALFKWRSRLESTHKLQPEEVEKCIRIINENLFATAIPNNELFKTVLREKDSKNERLTAVEKDNIYNKIADDITAKYDIISYFDNFYMFNGVYYKPINDIDVEKIIHFEISKNINKTGRGEILEFLRIKTQVSSDEFDKHWYKIACRNGILNLVTGELEQATKTEINTIYIPLEYDPDPPYSPRIDQFMKELTGGDAIKMLFLYQIAGYCLLKKNLFEKFFIFRGEGGTGKSTYTNLLVKLVGEHNCSHIALADFDKDYYLAAAVSKVLNIDDDVVDSKVLMGTGRFKSVISGNEIAVRQIYKAVISFKPYITCVFSCNKLPKIMDKTSGLYRRMTLVELNNKIKTPDPLFLNKITDQDMQYFLYKAVDAIKLAIEEGHFKVTQSERQLLDLFKRHQSPLNEWLYECDLTRGDIVGVKCITLYQQFIEWCDTNGYGKHVTSFTFKEDICNLYDIEITLKPVDDSKTLVQVFHKRGEYDANYKPF